MARFVISNTPVYLSMCICVFVHLCPVCHVCIIRSLPACHSVSVTVCLCFIIISLFQQKNMQKEHNTMSFPDQRWTVHLTWSLGAYKLPPSPGGSWRTDSPGWEKAEDKFTATSGLRVRVYVCVSCVASIYSRVCSSVSCVPIKPDKLLLLLLLLMAKTPKE